MNVVYEKRKFSSCPRHYVGECYDLMKQYWMVKQEPTAYAWEQFVKDGRTDWTGVRNFQARNYLRTMKKGDTVLYYHSVVGKEVVGVAEVSRVSFPDPSATEGDWSSVELIPKKTLKRPVTLVEIKADPALKEISLLRQSRLSVMPLREEEYKRLLALSQTKKD